MNRRQCVAAMMLTAVGCRSRFKEAAVIETIDWPQRISERAAQQVPTTHVITFDPALAYLIGQLIYGLIRYCLAAQIRRQHSAIVAHPHGAVERRMRSKLTRQYLDEHPTADAVTVDQHVADTLAAFAKATKAEIEDLIAAAKNDDTIDPLQWERARHAQELTEINE